MSTPTGQCFEFRLIVSGLDLEDENQLDSLLTGFNGDASVSGTTTSHVEVLLTIPGDDPLAIISSAISHLTALLPRAAVCHLNEELVGVSDIAQLTGKTRESIRLYADGKRGPGAFPAPVGVVGDNVRVWRWGDVDPWLRQHMGYDFPTTPIPSWTIDTINASLHSPSGHWRDLSAVCDPNHAAPSSASP